MFQKENIKQHISVSIVTVKAAEIIMEHRALNPKTRLLSKSGKGQKQEQTHLR